MMQKKKEAATAPSEAVRSDAPEKAKYPIPIDGETGSTAGQLWLDVDPNEIVSIVAGNRSLVLQSGITGIVVHYNTDSVKEG